MITKIKNQISEIKEVEIDVKISVILFSKNLCNQI